MGRVPTVSCEVRREPSLRSTRRGWYWNDYYGTYYGFVRHSSGIFTSLDMPKSPATFPQAINDRGVITGSYAAGGPNWFPAGFVRVP